ncbi:MAG TPA: YggT family protein [Longimicrobiaceae bacterium]|nr:YggT family protein [Longimicrobiaceae bacterium]
MVLVNVLEVLKWLIIARALMSWFVDPRSANPLVAWIRGVTDAILGPLRSLLPNMGGMDLSPLVAILLIHLAQQAIASGPASY